MGKHASGEWADAHPGSGQTRRGNAQKEGQRVELEKLDMETSLCGVAGITPHPYLDFRLFPLTGRTESCLQRPSAEGIRETRKL